VHVVNIHVSSACSKHEYNSQAICALCVVNMPTIMDATVAVEAGFCNAFSKHTYN